MLLLRPLYIITYSNFGALTKDLYAVSLIKLVIDLLSSKTVAQDRRPRRPFKHSTFKQSAGAGWERDLSTQHITYRALLGIEAG